MLQDIGNFQENSVISKKYEKKSIFYDIYICLHQHFMDFVLQGITKPGVLVNLTFFIQVYITI
jgi:hypothetical protein